MQRLVAAAVHHLQQLHGELHVAQSAGAEFDLAGADVGGDQLLNPPPHGLHFDHEVLTLAGDPDHGHQRGQVALAEFRVADRRPGFQQRLELPGFRPSLVVGDVRLDRPDQLTAAALGPQPGVHLEERRRGHPHHLAGHPGAGRVGVLGDEDDVDVADVVQFAGTAFAHRDDRQPRRRAVAAHGHLGHPQRGRQRGVRDVGQLGADHGERQHRLVLDRRGHIERGQHQQVVAVQVLQFGDNQTGVGRAGQRFVDARVERLVQLDRTWAV